MADLTVRGGNCNHRRYIPRLVGLVASGAFDRRRPGWIEVELLPKAG